MHVPTKALFVVGHANLVHPDRPVVVVYEGNPLAARMEQEFKTFPVAGKACKYRPVFRLTGDLRGKSKQNLLHNFIAAAATQEGVPPVLIAQYRTFNMGTDGLQVSSARA